jgi:hypothetical protein
MSEIETKLLMALSIGPKNIEVLISETGTTAAEALSVLTMVELRRLYDAGQEWFSN